MVVLLTMVACTVPAERKICAAIQGRIGPNRAGPFGRWQPLADAVKPASPPGAGVEAVSMARAGLSCQCPGGRLQACDRTKNSSSSSPR
ncbi:MAG: NADH-quinone oxidoreductase subunit H [Verrucomicrobia bacterium]|nr:NADH-quinone oxidoreductase subunit H [Verrucomicrobiota bacterium]